MSAFFGDMFNPENQIETSEPMPLSKRVDVELFPEENDRPALNYAFINKSRPAEVFTEKESMIATYAFVLILSTAGLFLGVGLEDGDIGLIMNGIGLMTIAVASVGTYLYLHNKAQSRQDKLLGEALIKELIYRKPKDNNLMDQIDERLDDEINISSYSTKHK
jgi:hypothetical protein